MTEDELKRRRQRHPVLCELMLLLVGEDADYWNVHTYGELIRAAAEALEKERDRIAEGTL